MEEVMYQLSLHYLHHHHESAYMQQTHDMPGMLHKRNLFALTGYFLQISWYKLNKFMYVQRQLATGNWNWTIGKPL
jgi:hypothetical protein